MADRSDELLTLKEVAARLKVRDARTARRVLARGGVPVLSLGRSVRVRSSDLTQLLERAARFEGPADRSPESEKRAQESPAPAASRRGKRQRRAAGSRAPVSDEARRGWRERVDRGLYRAHRKDCRASRTRRNGSRCSCPWQTHVASDLPGKTRLKSFAAANVGAARKEARRLKAVAAERPDNRGGEIRLDDFFWNVYLPNKTGLVESTRDSATSVYRNHIGPALGHLRLVDIRREHVEGWVLDLGRKAEADRARRGRRNPGSVSARWMRLQAIFQAAVEWDRLPANPANRIDLPDCDPHREGEEDEEVDARKVLLPGQLELLYDAARTCRYRPLRLRNEVLFRLGAETCLRNSEVRGLMWGAIDLSGRELHVRRQADRNKKRCKATKGKQRRPLPLTEHTASLLEEHLHDERGLGASERSDFVFHAIGSSDPLCPQSPKDLVHSAQRRAELVGEDNRPLIDFHGLRHTGASILLCNGMSLWKVSRFLGHSSVTVTERVYAHLLHDGELDELAQVFEDLRSGRDGGE